MYYSIIERGTETQRQRQRQREQHIRYYNTNSRNQQLPYILTVYRKQQGSRVVCTKDMSDPDTLFCVKQWRGGGGAGSTGVKQPQVEILMTDIIHIRSRTGDYLCHGLAHLGAQSNDSVHVERRTMDKLHRHQHASFEASDLNSHERALMILPMSAEAMSRMRRFRRQVNTLDHFLAELSQLPDICVAHQGQAQDEMLATMVYTCNLWHTAVSGTLTTLILEVSLGEETNPFVKDGPPNRLMQKELRELNLIPLLVYLLQKHFDKGLAYRLHTSDKTLNAFPDLDKIVQVLNLCFRLLRMMMKANDVNANMLFWFWLNDKKNSPRNHFGKGVSTTDCVIGGKSHTSQLAMKFTM
jgi:hypothetical protein